MRIWIVALTLLWAPPALAELPNLQRIVDEHVLPGYRMLAEKSSDLESTAASNCSNDSPELISAYHEAFDAWMGVSHLRFGPSEVDERAFALAFWPDPRGSTPKTLSTLVRNQDPVVEAPEDFATVSVAARGFYALEFLLFDAQFGTADGSGYTCQLIQGVATDIAANAAAILGEWLDGYGALITSADNDTYRTDAESAQQFFTSLATGLEFTSNMRLGRPLGTFDRPRPNRAEARRSERSLRNVGLSLSATMQLAALLSQDDSNVAGAFEASIARVNELDDPVFSNVKDTQGRFRVEALKQSIDNIRQLLADEVGPQLGIAAGFNALDGD